MDTNARYPVADRLQAIRCNNTVMGADYEHSLREWREPCNVRLVPDGAGKLYRQRLLGPIQDLATQRKEENHPPVADRGC